MGGDVLLGGWQKYLGIQQFSKPQDSASTLDWFNDFRALVACDGEAGGGGVYLHRADMNELL